MFYPDYQRVNAPAARTRFRQLWNTPLDPDPGLTVVEIMNAAKKHEIRGMYVMGENPAMSDPRRGPRPRGPGGARSSGGAGHFPDGNGLPRRCGLAATAWPEKIGTGDQYRPHGAARTKGHRAAGRGPRGLLAA
jgi:formate dehydrogenase major subunit